MWWPTVGVGRELARGGGERQGKRLNRERPTSKLKMMRLKRVQVGSTDRIEVDNFAPSTFATSRSVSIGSPRRVRAALRKHYTDWSVPTGTSVGDRGCEATATGPILGMNEKLCLMKQPCRAQWDVLKRPRLGSCHPPLRSRVPKVAASFLRKGPTPARRHAERLNQTQRAIFEATRATAAFQAIF